MNDATEEWRVIAAAPAYAVSNLGRVKRVTPGGNVRTERLRKLRITPAGYVQLSLYTDGQPKTFLVHRLVCEAFHGPAPSYAHEVAHGDGCASNNRADNLRWATPSENQADKRMHGTVPDFRGERSARAKVTDAIVQEIRGTRRYNGVLPDLAAKHGLMLNTVCTIRTRNGGKWPHIPFPDHVQPPTSKAS